MVVVMRDRSRSGVAVARGRLHADERWETRFGYYLVD